MLSPESPDSGLEFEAVESLEDAAEEARTSAELGESPSAFVAEDVAPAEETPTESPEAISAEPIEPDPVLLAAIDQARAALAEITDPSSIGEPAGFEVHEAKLLTLFFTCTLPGYPGWRWAAAVTRVDEDSPVNVLEVELLPGEGSLTAPAWLPWSERLAQYRETQAQQAAEQSASGTSPADGDDDHDDDEFVDDELDSDIMVNDFNDFDDEIDGVDIDAADDEDDDDHDDDEDDDAIEGEDEGDFDDSDDDDEEE